MQNQWVPLLDCLREDVPEVTVHGAVAWVHGDQLIHNYGTTLCYGRSLMKPYQIKVFAQDLDAVLGWEAKAIAVASHNAETAQLAAARSILSNADLRWLQTPAALPLVTAGSRAKKPTRWNHPCSGKHAAILAGCKLRGWSRHDYLTADHPYFAAYLAELRAVLGADWTPAVTAVDGCGLPTLTMTIQEMATLFAALAALKENDWIWPAMVRHPELVGGRNRLDTAILVAGDGKIVAKEGADGLLGLAIDHPSYPRGLGIVIKIAHGWDPKATWFVAAKILEKFGVKLQNTQQFSGQKVFVHDSVAI
ncbi:MAG: asparaginase [Proteobacteria bacterium]|nr:asparaginase [Pseudomonadota bacterium]